VGIPPHARFGLVLRRGWAIVVAALLGGALLSGCSSTPHGSPPAYTSHSHLYDVQVFMKPRATRVEVAAVETARTSDAIVAGCSYLNHRQSHAFAKKIFGKQPQIIDVLTPAAIATVFQCRVRGPGGPAAIKVLVNQHPGVYEIEAPGVFPLGVP
jgi:hypothetical protein